MGVGLISSAAQLVKEQRLAPVPGVLQRLGVRTNHVNFRFPKVILAMDGVVFSERDNVKAKYRAQLDKSRFLRFFSVICAAGAVPRDGLRRDNLIRITHDLLAKMAGYKYRSSYTRNGRRAPRLIARDWKRLVKGCVYRFMFDEGSPRWGGIENFSMPTAKEMRQNDEFQKYWANTSAEFAGYYLMPGWIFDPYTPGNPNQKLVLLALGKLGLFKLNGANQGELQKPLETIAGVIGVSKDTVRSALAFYEAQGLIQVKHHPARYELNGKQVPEGTEGAVLRQPPNTIYYVAGREFDQLKAEHENKRFQAAVNAVPGLRESVWFEHIEKAWSSTVYEWVGTRQLERTLFREIRKRMQDRNIPPKFIEALVPPPRDE